MYEQPGNFERKNGVEERAEAYYSPELPYHNFEHARAAVKAGEPILARAKAEGIDVDEEAVRTALYFHDAGYFEDAVKKGFPTKEAYATQIAEKELRAMGYPETFIQKVKTAILGTHRTGIVETNEAKIVRAADLANIAGDYEKFIESNQRLKREAELISGHPFSWAEWKISTKKVIEFYLSQDIRLTSGHDDMLGNSLFHKNGRANLARFLAEDEAVLDT